MKVGGNQAASEYFSKNGASMNTSDARMKYSSRAGQQYKELLAKRTAEDAVANPNTVVIDIHNGIEEPPATPLTPGEQPQQQPEPINIIQDDSSVATSSVEEDRAETPISDAKPLPVVVKVSSPTARAARSSVGGARAPRKSTKSGKLGVKKTPVNFNFEAAEAQAKQDLERTKKYGLDEEEQVEGGSSDTIKPSLAAASTFSRLDYIDSSTSSERNKEDEYEKLGFGMSRLKMDDKKTSISMPSQKPYQQQEEDSRTAREKFGSAKAISSDQYFGRNDYDPAISAAESSRLSQFSSAKAISSDQYFGRESEMSDQRNRSYSNSNAGDWDNVQDQAVAMARKFVDQAALDLDAVKDLAGNATNMVRNYFNT
ncbi:hypothetical protein [Parasitella parasitica]|uniref:Uncharacterized protein n=1 Tax=Parasitella parasitica TaxID=35722 RepID=A0A0B7NJE5_9FUNG|nr:hypothetical protein [Parasitella parasitica]